MPRHAPPPLPSPHVRLHRRPARQQAHPIAARSAAAGPEAVPARLVRGPRRRLPGNPGHVVTGAVVLLALAFVGAGGPSSALARPGPTPAPSVGAAPAAGSPAPAGAAAAPATPVPGAGEGVPPNRAMVEEPGPTAPPVEGLEGYVWPLPRGRLTNPYGPSPWGGRVVDGERFHDGIDLATFCGDRIVAAHAGRVLAAGRRYDAFIGWDGDLGPYTERLQAKGAWYTLPIVVVIDDGNGYRSVYAHFSRVVVKPGQRVRAGQFLGYEGRTGRASGCHLHYALFSPWERDRIELRPDIRRKMLLPATMIARVDPLLVLPERSAPRPAATLAPGATPPPAEVGEGF